MQPPLSSNGQVMSADFPVVGYERAFNHVRAHINVQGPCYEHFAGAWNALSFRFRSMVDEEGQFAEAVTGRDAGETVDNRYCQERHLFGFFSNGFSAFDSYFYGMFSIGSELNPTVFPIATPKDQQRISPVSTQAAYSRAFANDPILAGFAAVFADPAYVEWKDVRNVLTHRTAPGRTIFAVTSGKAPPPQWKLNNISLDSRALTTRRAHAARLLGMLLDAAAVFVERRMI
jgi:hypothetical protein